MLRVPDDERPASRGYPAGIPRSGPIMTYRDLRVVPWTREFVSGRTAEYRVGSLHTAEVGGSSPLAPTRDERGERGRDAQGTPNPGQQAQDQGKREGRQRRRRAQRGRKNRAGKSSQPASGRGRPEAGHERHTRKPGSTEAGGGEQGRGRPLGRRDHGGDTAGSERSPAAEGGAGGRGLPTPTGRRETAPHAVVLTGTGIPTGLDHRAVTAEGESGAVVRGEPTVGHGEHDGGLASTGGERPPRSLVGRRQLDEPRRPDGSRRGRWPGLHVGTEALVGERVVLAEPEVPGRR